MSERKNYNSIIFLTTLSVYLGLVLVGAPAHVLAQAALTSRLEVKDKIEKTDDLDKKPDESADEKTESSAPENQTILDYTEVVRVLLEASRQANPHSFSYEFETKSDAADKIQLKRIRFTNLDKGVSNSPQIFHQINSETHKLFNLFPAEASYNDSNVVSCFKLSDKGFTVESKFSQKDANIHGLLKAYNTSLWRLKREIFNEQKTLVLNHTEIVAEGNQFVIVTRLPRGSLDALITETSAK